MKNKYSFQAYDEKTMARARALYIPASRKEAYETARFIRGRPLNWTIGYLEQVWAGKKAIPFARFTWDVGHKRGMATGRYPHKVSFHFIRLLNAVKKIAENKGLNSENLSIIHFSAYKGPVIWHHGRHSRRERKVTMAEVVVGEIKEEKEKKEQKKQAEKKVKLEEKLPEKKEIKLIEKRPEVKPEKLVEKVPTAYELKKKMGDKK